MKTTLALILTAAAAGTAWGQAEIPAKPSPSVVNCRACHTSDAPTKADPALVKCPRAATKGVHSASEAPPSLTLGSAGGKYGPVKFSHKAHAEMSEMDGGCYRCHHYDQGGRIQGCGECHSPARARADVGKPDLKGALHRLCVDCHRQWSRSESCAPCHGGKAPPKSELPRRMIFTTKSDAGKVVTFPHGDHAGRFGLRCADCHQAQACSTCHDPSMRGLGAPPRPAKAEPHQSCAKCHAKDKCASCHSDKPTGSFDHGRSTGWIHNRFHARLECRRCHGGSGKFTRIDRDCESCHKGWQAAFDHKKTGLALDENHAALGCADCHADGVFTAPPACGACHDRSYPKDVPGKRAGGAGKK